MHENQITRVSTGLASLVQTNLTDDHPGSHTRKETRFKDYVFLNATTTSPYLWETWNVNTFVSSLFAPGI